MMGLPTNEREGCFWPTDLDEAAGHLVEVIREVGPQVLVTYDTNGGYGHPDHIQAHRVAMRAVERAARPDGVDGSPWQVAKVSWKALPESWLRDSLRRLREAGDTTTFEGMDPDADELPMVVPDDQVTTVVEAVEHVEAELAAMRAHATPITVDGPFFALSNNLGNQVWGIEAYVLAHGTPGPQDRRDDEGRETDLFSGLD